VSQTASEEAWNNFVMSSQADRYKKGSMKWAAFIAKYYMNQVNGGGINSFLTNSWDMDAKDVVSAIRAIGALTAAREFEHVLEQLGVPVSVSSQDARWDLMEKHWPDKLNENDFLSDEAEKDLIQRLESHVLQNEKFYLTLE
jgi:hypothetical protein